MRPTQFVTVAAAKCMNSHQPIATIRQLLLFGPPLLQPVSNVAHSLIDTLNPHMSPHPRGFLKLRSLIPGSSDCRSSESEPPSESPAHHTFLDQTNATNPLFVETKLNLVLFSPVNAQPVHRTHSPSPRKGMRSLNRNPAWPPAAASTEPHFPQTQLSCRMRLEAQPFQLLDPQPCRRTPCSTASPSSE